MSGYYKIKKKLFYYDPWILLSVALLMAVGLLMVGSASMVVADKQYGFPFYYVVKQSIFLVIGLTAALLVSRIPIRVWHKISSYLILLCLFLLVIVLIPGIGRVVNGSRRWIYLGITSVQVSELVKLFIIVYLASYLDRFSNQVQTELKGFIKPVILLGVIGVLLLLEPDFGALTVITIAFFGLLFVSGARLLPFSILFLVVALVMITLAITSPYRLLRLTTFMDPWSRAYGAGYQLTQSLIAFGRGGLWGVGLGNSVQKLFYLPEAHSDFIFAVLGEELGLVGELLLIGLYVLLVGRIVMIAYRAKLAQFNFSSYIAFGIALWLGWQSMINIGVNIGVLPTKGLTLPFISYGGSSLIVNCLAMGLILRISFETQLANGLIPTAVFKNRSSKKRRALT